MTQNTEQKARSREDSRWDGLPQNPELDGFHWLKQNGGGRPIPFEWDASDEVWLFDDCSDLGYPDSTAKIFQYIGPCHPPEARGAAEQRRKDGEGQEVAYYIDHRPGSGSPPYAVRGLEQCAFPEKGEPVYTHPANVAALEDRIAEWQPIDTGPTDETVVLLFLPDTREIITGYSDGKRSASSNKLIWHETLSGHGYEWDGCLYDDPTHWMSLPLPPEDAAGTPS